MGWDVLDGLGWDVPDGLGRIVQGMGWAGAGWARAGWAGWARAGADWARAGWAKLASWRTPLKKKEKKRIPGFRSKNRDLLRNLKVFDQNH